MLKVLSPYKTITNFNSRKNKNIKPNLKASKSLTNIKIIKPSKTKKGSKTSKYINKYIFDISNIFKLEKNLTKKEKDFKRNVSNKIILKRDLTQKISNNVVLLENKIIDNYNSLKICNYNYDKTNKNILKNLYNKKQLKILNKEYNNNIY